ncbi:phosphatase PAP2 family protein [Streptomyces spinosus]|uniref:phosphatase PAP2 family protein n=1 Tax=Streptomyces spinosus TaxID=2872623 RepID=UPI001CEDF09E|nr:phosphatase PAP2 family protein [Streptomyces spinosus]
MRVSARLAAAGCVSAGLGLLVYAGFVRTAAGQRWENAVLAGRARDETPTAVHQADRVLDHITVMSLGSAVGVLVVIGVARRRPALTAVAVGTVAGSLALSEVLKRQVLGRPDLVGAPPHLLHNSFPSGHTTIAMSVLSGLTLIVPYRLRAAVVGVCSLWATGVGAYTVAAGWHRPSDTIGADLLVLTVACGLTAVLARTGRVRPAPGHRHLVGSLLVVVPLVGVAVLGLGTGGLLAVGALSHAVPAWSGPGPAYTAGHALAAGFSAASTLALLTLLTLLRHCDLGRPRGSRETRNAGPAHRRAL